MPTDGPLRICRLRFKRSMPNFTKEFKSETVALIRYSGKSIAVCREMRLPESSVHRWLAQADIDTDQL
jgi:transposase-like protein